MSKPKTAPPRSRSWAFAVVLVLVALSAPLASVQAADPDTTPPDTWFQGFPYWVTETSYDAVITASEPGSTFECRLDDEPWAPCTSPHTFADLAEGFHQAEARATDPSGNVDPTPVSDALRVDLSGPVGQVVINGGDATVHRGLVSVYLPATDIASLGSVILSVTPDLASNGRLIGHERTDYWADQDKIMTFDLSGGSMTPGPRTVYAQWQDTNGHFGPVASDTVMFDPSTRPPTSIDLKVTQRAVDIGSFFAFEARVVAADGAPVRDGQLSFDGYSFGAHSSGHTVPGSQDVYGWSGTMPAGTYRLRAWFHGSEELADSSAAVTITVGPGKDTDPPETYLSPNQDMSGRPAAGSFDVTGSADAVRYECRLDGGAWQPCTTPWSFSVSDGPHVAQARAVDQAGLVDPSPATVPWSVGPGPETIGWINTRPVDFGNSVGVSARPDLELKLETTLAEATAVRVSNSQAWDGQVLTQAKQYAWPTPTFIPWDFTDTTAGGTTGDGSKVVWAQWRDGTGAWSTPVFYQTVIDQTKPALTMVANGGSSYVRHDEIMVFLRPADNASRTDWYKLAGSPEELADQSAMPLYNPFVTFDLADAEEGAEGIRRVYAQVFDQAGNASPVVSTTVILDRKDPVASLAAPAFVTGVQASPTAIRMRFYASARDGGSGIATIRLEEDGPSSGLKTIATRTTTSITTERSVSSVAGTSYRFRGTDRVARTGWATSPSWQPVARAENSSLVGYTGTWTRPASSSAWGGRIMRTTAVGSTAKLTFSGKAVAIVAPMSSTSGRFQVYIDGQYVKTVDLKRTASLSRVVVFATKFSTAQQRTLTLKVIETPGRNRVDVDAFLVLP